MTNVDGYERWRKSARSKDSEECVEVGASVRAGGGVGVRDSKQRDGSVLPVSAAAWCRFAQEVKSGLHDPRG